MSLQFKRRRRASLFSPETTQQDCSLNLLLSVTKVYAAPGSKLTAEQRSAVFIFKCCKLHICELPYDYFKLSFCPLRIVYCKLPIDDCPLLIVSQKVLQAHFCQLFAGNKVLFVGKKVLFLRIKTITSG